MGWRIEGQTATARQVRRHRRSPHLNWDFVIFIALKFVLRLNARWFGKHSIFRWPFGGLMRSWGGIPIRRHLNLNMVEQAIQGFRDNR